MRKTNSLLLGLKKIRRGPLREQVQDQITELILTNQLKPGAVIVIDQLASALDVSHTPVREALARLENDGLVTMKPYENPRVAPILDSDVRDAWEMRFLLEGWAIRKAAKVLPDEDLDDLGELLHEALSDARESNYEKHQKSDILLHETILRVADNKLFLRMARLLNDHSVRIRHLVEAIGPTEQVLQMIEEHFAILEALEIRDPEQAHERLMTHLEAGMRRTLATLQALRENGA